MLPVRRGSAALLAAPRLLIPVRRKVTPGEVVLRATLPARHRVPMAWAPCATRSALRQRATPMRAL